MDAYPADCVYLGLAGLMKEQPADLVVSSINGGMNIGPEWFGSGTIGAARTAAFVAVPAPDERLAELQQSVPQWR